MADHQRAGGGADGGRGRLWTRGEFLRAAAGAVGGLALARPAGAGETPVVRIAASRGIVSAPIWNVSNHAARYGFGVQMSVKIPIRRLFSEIKTQP